MNCNKKKGEVAKLQAEVNSNSFNNIYRKEASLPLINYLRLERANKNAQTLMVWAFIIRLRLA